MCSSVCEGLKFLKSLNKLSIKSSVIDTLFLATSSNLPMNSSVTFSLSGLNPTQSIFKNCKVPSSVIMKLIGKLSCR